MTGRPMDARIHARRRQVMRERARRRRRLTTSAAVLALLVAAGVGLARSPLFAIVDVRVTGAHGEEAVVVRETAGVRPGDNLLAADLRAAAERVAALPWVREARARRIPPSTVELRTARREPVVVVRVADASWLVDAEGIVVAGGTRDGLAEVIAPHSVLPGVGAEVRDAAVRNALSARAQLPAGLRNRVLRYEARSARDLRLHLVEGVVVRFGAADGAEAKARSVLLLLQQVRAHAERPLSEQDPPDGPQWGVTEIDVRAPDNPVLVPAPAATPDPGGAES